MLHKSAQGPETPEEYPILFMMKMVADRAVVLFNAMAQNGAELPTPAQGRVLMYLKSRNGGPVSQRELEHYLGVSHTTAKGLVQRLEERGYVRSAFDSEDGRVKHIYLAEYSARLHEALRNQSRRLEERMLEGLSPAECAELHRLMQHVFHNIIS